MKRKYKHFSATGVFLTWDDKEEPLEMNKFFVGVNFTRNTVHIAGNVRFDEYAIKTKDYGFEANCLLRLVRIMNDNIDKRREEDHYAFIARETCEETEQIIELKTGGWELSGKEIIVVKNKNDVGLIAFEANEIIKWVDILMKEGELS